MSLIRSLAYVYRRKVLLVHGSHSHGFMMSHARCLASLDQRRFNYQCNPGHKTKIMEMSSDLIVRRPFPHTPPPPRSPFSTWARWVIGSMLTLLLPFWEKKWTSSTLLRIEGEAEMVADAVEQVAEVVEKVATVAEKVSSEVAERLPENGKAKVAVLLVEHVSREAAQDAHLAKDIIHKVDDVKQDVELLLESVVHAGKATGGKDQK